VVVANRAGRQGWTALWLIDQQGVTRLKNQLKSKRKRQGEQERSEEDKEKQTSGRPVRVSSTVPCA